MIVLFVNSDDIKNGMVGSTCDCPIALALKRKFKMPYADADELNLHVSDSVCMSPNTRRFIPTGRTRKFMRRFDRCRKVRPTVFLLFEGDIN
jgi:hypothetical protein